MEDLLRTLSRTLRTFEVGETEIRIYSLLLQERLTPRQIARKIGLSERIVRERLKHLLELGLVERTLVNRGWLGYVYYAKIPADALNDLFNRIESVLENFREKAIKEVKG